MKYDKEIHLVTSINPKFIESVFEKYEITFKNQQTKIESKVVVQIYTNNNVSMVVKMNHSVEFLKNNSFCPLCGENGTTRCTLFSKTKEEIKKEFINTIRNHPDVRYLLIQKKRQKKQ